MAKTKRKTTEYLTYVALRLAVTVLHVLGLRANYALARVLGGLMYRFSRRHRERALRHLELSFPHWSSRRREQVAREAMRGLFYLGVEMTWTPRLIRPETWRRHVRLTHMGESIHALLQEGHPMIFLTGHFGNWEVVGYTMATLGFPTYAVARLIDNPHLNAYVTGIREKTGLAILDKRGVAARVDELLSGSQIVCFIADQDAGRKGYFVDFFGRQASTYKSIGLMAAQHGVPVVVGYGRRLDTEGFRFELGIRRAILPAEWADKDNAPAWITQEYTRALEEVIRTAPEQYLWHYRRWRSRPRGEEPSPDGIA